MSNNYVFDEYTDTLTVIEEEQGAIVIATQNTAVITIDTPGPVGPAGTNKADIILYLQSQILNVEILLDYNPSANQTLIGNNSTAFCRAGSTATTNTYINILQNSVVVGNIHFQAGVTQATMNFGTINLVKGDLFQIINAATADITLGNIRITLSGTRG